MVHDPCKHHDFVLLFELKNADLAGAVSPDPARATGAVKYGLVTEAAIKGLIGQRVHTTHGLPALIRWPGRVQRHLLEPLSRCAEGQPLLQELCRYFYDVRLFGLIADSAIPPCALPQTQEARRTQVGVPWEAALSGPTAHVPGAVRLSSARTVDPLLPWTNGQAGSYGLYRLHGRYDPRQGQANGVTAADLEVLWKTLTNLFESGPEFLPLQMGVCGLWVFSHDGQGTVPAETLLGQVAPTRVTEVPRSLRDYCLHYPEPGPLAADPRVVLTHWA